MLLITGCRVVLGVTTNTGTSTPRMFVVTTNIRGVVVVIVGWSAGCCWPEQLLCGVEGAPRQLGSTSSVGFRTHDTST